jgi:hypothetical protein
VEADNGMRPGSILSRLIPDKRAEFLSQLEQGVAFMQVSGCQFTDEEIELMAMGDQDEAEAHFAQYQAYDVANKALNNLFDPERAWILTR